MTVQRGGAAADAMIESGGTAIISAGGHLDTPFVFPFASATIIASGAVLSNNGVMELNEELGNTLAILEIQSGAVVTGSGVIDDFAGIVEIGGSFGENVVVGSSYLFIPDSAGNTSAYSGTISGFGGHNHSSHDQFIELSNVTFVPGAISGSFAHGVLQVTSSGATVADIKFAGTYVTSNFQFAAGSGGVVQITDPGVVNGGSVEFGPALAFPAHDIDLPDIAFGAQTTLAYAGNGADTGGTLTVTDGRHAAAIALLGNYMAGSFVAAADGHGGTLVTETLQTHQPPPLSHPRA